MILAVFETPWYALPITGAVAGTILAIFGAFAVALYTFRYQRHLKLIEAMWTIGRDLQTFENAVYPIVFMYMGVKSPTRPMAEVNHLAEVLSQLGISTCLLGLYGNETIEKSGQDLYVEVERFQRQLAIMTFLAGAGDGNISADTKKFCHAWARGEPQAKYKDNWLQIQKLTKTNMDRGFLPPIWPTTKYAAPETISSK